MSDVSGVVTDSSGNGRNALAGTAGTTYGVPGLLNQDPTNNCMDFAGGWVDTTYGSWMDYTTHTIECWVKTDGGSSIGLVDRDHGGNRVFQFRISGNKLEAIVFNTGGSVTSVAGATTLFNNVIYHLAYTFDGSVARVYVNGVLDGTSGAMSGTLKIGAANMVMGSLRAGGGSPGTWNLDGKLDDVAVYGTALSATRLLAHYNAGYVQPPAAAQLSAMTQQVVMQLDNVEARNSSHTVQAAMYLDNVYARFTDMVFQVALQKPTDTIKVLSTDDFVRVYYGGQWLTVRKLG